MILVTGAAGKTGRAVISALLKKGEIVRALVRRGKQIEEMVQLGVNEAVAGDLLDNDYLNLAHQKINAVYHICPNVHPDEIEMGKKVIQAARNAEVHHFVFHSVLHPQVESMPHHWKKMRVEELLFQSGVPFTILQPSAYMQNVLAQWEEITGQGLYQVPYRVDARLSMVDLEDIAKIAAKVLTEPGHTGATYELAGPECLSQVEVAESFSSLLGRRVMAHEMDMDQWREGASKAGLGNYAIEALTKMFLYYDRFGLQGNPQVLQSLLGRAPTNFKTFVQRVILNCE
jgi:uncharacterized protein YbjT (DUF2867 family)